MQIQMMKHDTIEPDPRNPRQVLDEARLVELANDIAVNGLLQPLTVRPHPERDGMYMLVFGERRWRACDMIELDQVPVIVRDVDDLQALELQIAENNKRADVHPLEEADAFRRLHEDHGRDVDEIAELCGKSRAYIYAAMKLCALTAEPRKAFLAGELDKSRALLVARLPEKHQVAATKMILEQGDYDEGGVMSYREAQRYIRDEFMLRLADAPFSVTDAGLVETAGPCTTCEKRTGNQRELFDDVVSDKDEGGADVCTDSSCYKQKVDVHWARVKVSAEEKGHKVIEGADWKSNGGASDKKHVDLDQKAYDIGKGDKTYRELLGKQADAAVAAVARTEDGEVRELISRSDLPALLKDAGVKAPKKLDDAGECDQDRYEREAKEQRELERIVTMAAREAALAQLDDTSDALLWRLVARLAIRCSRNDAQKELMKIHEVKHDGQYSGGQRAELIAFVDRLPERAARDFAIEMLLAEAGGWHPPETYQEKDSPEERLDYATGVEHAAQLLGIDLAGIVEKAKADLAAARTAKAEKKSKKAAPAEVES
jgi:ParB/RepB/Spo0J family partition protein